MTGLDRTWTGLDCGHKTVEIRSTTTVPMGMHRVMMVMMMTVMMVMMMVMVLMVRVMVYIGLIKYISFNIHTVHSTGYIHNGCLENDMRTRLGPGVSVSDGLSEPSSPFRRLIDFFFTSGNFGSPKAAVGVGMDADCSCCASASASCCAALRDVAVAEDMEKTRSASPITLRRRAAVPLM